MCFIKNIYKPLQSKSSFLGTNYNEENQNLSFLDNETSLSNSLKSQPGESKNKLDQSLQSLIVSLMTVTLKRNSFSINYIQDKIQECEEKIDDFLMELTEPDNKEALSEKVSGLPSSEFFTSEEKSLLKEEFSENPLTRKLFGEKKYKYKICLGEEFEKVIYKERNIKVNVNLQSMNGNVIKNSNVVNLCLGLADDNANWINCNRVSDPMLKGKTEVELYHGKANFNKIYTKDISRTFPNGRVNIVIYAKPSMLIYDGLTSEYEEHVDEESVEPLIIEEIVIKAKKKY